MSLYLLFGAVKTPLVHLAFAPEADGTLVVVEAEEVYSRSTGRGEGGWLE